MSEADRPASEPAPRSAERAAQRQAWEEAAGRQKQRRERFRASALELAALYDPGDLDARAFETQIGYPGQYPFTRGVQPTMYRGRLWTMRQYAGFGSAEETNRRFRYLLDQGQTGLSVAFDLPTQMGYDSDAALAAGEVGKVGVAIDTLADMEILFDQIPLDRVSTSMTINSPAAILLLMYQALAEKQGVSADQLRGTIQNDVLKEYQARGTFIFPPEPSLKITTDIFEYCRAHLPRWNTISISGYHIREAGSTAVEEIAFTLANGITYVQAAIDRGLDVDEFAPRLSFFFNAHNHLLEEVAKFRAARRLWAELMRERFGARNRKSWLLRFHTQTAGCTLTAQQPENNAVRVAYQALAAVLGGTQSLHTNSRDEALSLPSESAVLLALRTQQILAEESGVTDTIDPLAGSYAIERLTAEIAEAARGLIERIDAQGGVLTAIENGFIQRAIHRSAYEYQQEVERGERIVVGLNRHVMQEQTLPADFALDPQLEARQIARLREVRARRDEAALERALAALERAAREGANLLPPLYDCVTAYAGIGEMCDRLRRVFGAYRDPGYL
ncbi:MAG: methylmalonyl-CoA mutase [Candidatus Eisenbacteria bacterium]|nr:methylmalonyl-CoA mutase [Candidatus Eisenbacteria bacterium]